MSLICAKCRMDGARGCNQIPQNPRRVQKVSIVNNLKDHIGRSMGRKQAASFKKIYMRKKKRSIPTMPKAMKKALEAHGVEVPKGTGLREFYSRLGIQSDPNADVRDQIGFTDKLGEIKRKQRVLEPEPVIGDPEKFAEAAESIPHGSGYEKHLNDFELRCVMQLRAFYGDDYEMMALDFRRNPMQWSVGQIKRAFAIYEREAELLKNHRENDEQNVESNGEEEDMS